MSNKRNSIDSQNNTCVFLDTNVVMSQNKDLVHRVKLLESEMLFYVTDIVDMESQHMIRNQFCKSINVRNVISFSQMRLENPALCPVYYNLIASMYNPANLASPDFVLQMLQSLKLRGKKMTKNNNDVYSKLMQRLKISSDRTVHEDGTKKIPLAKEIDKGAFHYFRKRVKNKESISLMNDYRNLATMLIYSLLEETDIVFITADRDTLVIVITLAESIAQYMAFVTLIFGELSDSDIAKIMDRGRVMRFLSFEKFCEVADGCLGDIINSTWMKQFIEIKFRLWSDEENDFVDDYVLKFNDDLKDFTLNFHGQLSCPVAKNSTHFNWLSYKYWAPSVSSPDTVKISMTRKKIFNRKNRSIPPFVHDCCCKYVCHDRNGELVHYSGFWM